LRKATVSLLPGGIQNLPAGANIRFTGMQSASTDDNGAYVLNNVNPGNYQLQAERNNYVTQRYGARNYNSPGTPLALKEGDKLTKINIVMTAQGVIMGSVLDQDGDPVSGVQVQALRYAYQNGQRQLRAEGMSTATDFRGAYTISGLMPGRYYIQASMRNQPGQASAATLNVTTFFPSSLDLRGATAVEVGAGAELTNMAVRLRREKVYTIRGTVLSGGTPVNGVSLTLMPQDTPVTSGGPDILSNVLGNQVSSNREGKFEIRNVLPGSYALYGTQGGASMISINGGDTVFFRAAAPAPAGGGVNFSAPASGSSGRVQVNVAAEDVADIVLTLSPGSTITGSVKVDNGSVEELLKGIKPPTLPDGVVAPAGLGALNVRLAPTGQGISAGAPSSPVDPSGSFTLGSTAPSTYYVTVNGLPTGYYVKSMTFSGQDILRSPLDFSSGGGGQLEITLAKGVGEISGSVTDSQGRMLTGVTVSLWPRIPSRATANGGVRTVTTDQSGAFKFTGIVPGEYWTAAFEDLPDAGLGQYTGFLNGLTADATSVKLAENGTQSASLKPVSRDKIQAEVAKLP
jgi:protocatechuate 3,4-dioxygenase beta subunit